MKNIYTILIALLSLSASAQQFCNKGANVAIYSNYDGGVLTINVDTNIANLKIGVVAYENDSIILTGTYKNNVTKIFFAGFFNSNNKHCAPYPKVKSINGATIGTDSIFFYPPVTYNNPNGSNNIICNTSCNTTTSQGGCNTADQIADYFLKKFNSTKLLFHLTQYGCWTGVQKISAGGNCCAVPAGTGLAEKNAVEFGVMPNPSSGKFMLSGLPADTQSIEVFDLLGNSIYKMTSPTRSLALDLTGKSKGVYFLKLNTPTETLAKKIVIE